MLTRMRRGFTVIEIVVAVFMLAVLSAAIIPALMGRIRDAERSALSQTLFSLSLAIIEYRKAVSVNPGRIEYLGTPPTTPPGAVDACNNVLPPSSAANWRGPYITREVLSGGVGIGDSRIVNNLRREPGPPIRLFIDVEFVSLEIAAKLDAEFDGASASATTGTIRYQATALTNTEFGTVIPAAPSGMVTLSYGIPITGC